MSFIWNFLRRSLSTWKEMEEELLEDANVSVSTDDKFYSPDEESCITSLDETDCEFDVSATTTTDEENNAGPSLSANSSLSFITFLNETNCEFSASATTAADGENNADPSLSENSSLSFITSLNETDCEFNASATTATDGENNAGPSLSANSSLSFITSLNETDCEFNASATTATDKENNADPFLLENICTYKKFSMPSYDLNETSDTQEELPADIPVKLQKNTEEEKGKIALQKDAILKLPQTEIESSDESYSQEMPILTAEQGTSDKLKQEIFQGDTISIEAMQLKFNQILKRKRSQSETFLDKPPITKRLMLDGYSRLSIDLPETSQPWIQIAYKQQNVEEQIEKNLWEEFVDGLEKKCNEAQKLLDQTSQIPKTLPMFDCLLSEIKTMIDTLENYPKMKLAGSKLSCTINVLMSRQNELEKAKTEMMARILHGLAEGSESSNTRKSGQGEEGSANNEAMGNINTTAGSILNKITALAMKALTIYRKMCETPMLSRMQRHKLEEELIECGKSLKSLEDLIEEANRAAYLDALNFCIQTVGPTSPQSKFMN